jgi:hypothetical protein
VKQTVREETRPTLIAVKKDGAVYTCELEDEQAELDFVLGRFPVAFRNIESPEDLKGVLTHQIKWRRLKKNEKPESYSVELLRRSTDGFELATKVPARYDGLKQGDHVGIVMSGAGNRFAFALSTRGEKIGDVRVMRVPSFVLSRERGEASKDNDHMLLANLAETHPEFFYDVTAREREKIVVAELYRDRREVQHERIKAEQRLRSRLIGQIFLSEGGQCPEGAIEDEFKRARANSIITHSLREEEKKCEAKLRVAVRKLEVWRRIFNAIEGCGEVLTARIVSEIVDIRRFATAPGLKKVAGVHVMPDGSFVRRRRGQISGYRPDLRQALYLLVDQFVKRPDSLWGRRYRLYKKFQRQYHPEVVDTEEGKTQFSDMHIHRRAIWRTASRFVEWLHREWWRIEKEELEKAPARSSKVL